MMKKLLQTFADKLNDKITSLKERADARHEEEKPVKKAPSVKPPKQVVELEISARTVVKILLVVAGFWVLGQIFIQIQTWLTIGLICFFLAMGLAPIVDSLEKWRFLRIPRPVAILILYVGFLGVITILFVKVIPILAEQLQGIAYEVRAFFLNNNLEDIPFVARLMDITDFDPTGIQQFLTKNISDISRNLQKVAGSTVGLLGGIFASVFNFIFALVLLFFILLERESVGKFLLALAPKKDREYIEKKVSSVQEKISKWFRGQVILMISIGVLMYFGMKIFELTLGMKYAATIALVAGVMELFPYVGVIITGLLAGLIALNGSWLLLICVIAWMALIQFLEGNLLVPLVMEKVVGLSSVAVMLALAIGGTLGNAVGGVPVMIIGMILAVPVTASIAIFVQEYVDKDH